MLKDEGSGVDAAIAAVLCEGVVSSHLTGLGGYVPGSVGMCWMGGYMLCGLGTCWVGWIQAGWGGYRLGVRWVGWICAVDGVGSGWVGWVCAGWGAYMLGGVGIYVGWVKAHVGWGGCVSPRRGWVKC